MITENHWNFRRTREKLTIWEVLPIFKRIFAEKQLGLASPDRTRFCPSRVRDSGGRVPSEATWPPKSWYRSQRACQTGRRGLPGLPLPIFGKNSAKCCSFSAVSAPILQENMRFAAFFKIYQIIKLNFLKFDKILQDLRHLHFFCWNFTKIAVFSNRFFAKILRLQRCKRMQIL